VSTISPAHHGRYAADLHEQRELEVARQMAKLKARARRVACHHRAGARRGGRIISSMAGQNFGSWTGRDHVTSKIVASGAAAGGEQDQSCVDSYRLTTLVGMRPRSLTANPFAFAQARTCALCLRCAAVLRFVRTGRPEALRACAAKPLTASSNLSLCVRHRSIS
jgi:hypothetical protein